MEFVEDDGSDVRQEWIIEQPAEQDPLGDDRNFRPRADARFEANLIADLLTQPPAVFGGNPGGRGPGRDAAGLQLIEFLERLARELKEIEATFSFVEWRQWLNRQLESAEFRDTGVSSPVIFTHLSLTRLRNFDAVALIGADSLHLPGELDQGMFFNQSVRRQLGLPDAGEQILQCRDDLIGLISRSQSVLVTWQAMRSGEKNLPSPFVERLQVFHELAWKSPLGEGEAATLAAWASLPSPIAAEAPAMTVQPAPAASSSRLFMSCRSAR